MQYVFSGGPVPEPKPKLLDRSFMNESPSDKLNAIYFHLFEHFANENGRNNNNNLQDKAASHSIHIRHTQCDWMKETWGVGETERLKQIGGVANWYRVLFLFWFQLMYSNVCAVRAKNGKQQTVAGPVRKKWTRGTTARGLAGCVCVSVKFKCCGINVYDHKAYICTQINWWHVIYAPTSDIVVRVPVHVQCEGGCCWFQAKRIHCSLRLQYAAQPNAEYAENRRLFGVPPGDGSTRVCVCAFELFIPKVKDTNKYAELKTFQIRSLVFFPCRRAHFSWHFVRLSRPVPVPSCDASFSF